MVCSEFDSVPLVNNSVVVLLDPLDLIVATHEDTGLIVDVLGHHLEHSVHLAVDSLAASCREMMLTNRMERKDA